MSNVTQPLTGWGAWTVDLSDTTPGGLLQAANPWDHKGAIIRIYPGIVTVDQLDTVMPAYSGPVLQQTNRGRTLSGPGPVWYMGEWDTGKTIWAERSGAGPFTSTSITKALADGSLELWAVSVLSATNSGLTLGTVVPPYGAGAKRAGTIKGYTVRTIFESYFRVRFGARFRVNPDFTVDIGSLAQLYPQATVPVATPHGGRGAGGGFQVDELDLDVDATRLTTGTVVFNGNSAFVETADPTGWRNPKGAALNWRALTTLDGADTTEATEAASTMQSDQKMTRAATISTIDYDLGGRVKPGELVDIWDPAAGFYDLANTRTHRGDVIHPARLRVYQSTWPITAGMSVWLDRRHLAAGDAVDLTDHVVREDDDAPTAYDVGAPPRTLGRSTSR